MLNPVSNVQSSLQNMIDLIIGQDGILNNLNCGFLKRHLEMTHEDLCDGILPNTAKLGILFCLLGFAALCMSICNLCLTIRVKPKGYKDHHHHHGKKRKNKKGKNIEMKKLS